MRMSLVWVSAIRSSALRLVGFGDAGEVRARADLLAALDRDLLEDAGHAGLDLQIAELALTQVLRGVAAG